MIGAIALMMATLTEDPSTVKDPPATVQMSSSVAETPDLDRAVGIQRVRTFDELVSCIRAKNSVHDVKAFILETSMGAKVSRYAGLTRDCWTAAGVNLNHDFGALDRALGDERQAN